MELETLYNTDWLSENIGGSKRKWERMRQEGTGPEFVKAGKRILYRLSAIEEWLRRNTFTSTAEAKAAKNAEAAEIGRRYKERQLVIAEAKDEAAQEHAAGQKRKTRRSNESLPANRQP
jgi:hypothetical protein